MIGWVLTWQRRRADGSWCRIRGEVIHSTAGHVVVLVEDHPELSDGAPRSLKVIAIADLEVAEVAATPPEGWIGQLRM